MDAEQVARSQQREKEEVARLAAHKAELEVEAAAGPILTEIRRGHPDASSAAQKFLGSMSITFDMWHDGEGYDLAALGEIPDAERTAIETILINHRPRDWRDIEA